MLLSVLASLCTHTDLTGIATGFHWGRQKKMKINSSSSSTNVTYWDSRTPYECSLILISKQEFSAWSKIPDLLFHLRGQGCFPVKVNFLNNYLYYFFELSCPKAFKASYHPVSSLCQNSTYYFDLLALWLLQSFVFFPQVSLGW